MPSRKKPTLMPKEVLGALELTTHALGDIQIALDLWMVERSSSHGRILIRTFIVGLEAYYSSALYKIEFCRLVLKKTGHPEGRKAEYIDLNFSSTEIDFIYDSRSNALNAKRLKSLIKLVEKTFLTSNFDFGSGDIWASVRDLFEKRNDFTHPRNIDDF